jgi:hypothetical protein
MRGLQLKKPINLIECPRFYHNNQRTCRVTRPGVYFELGFAMGLGIKVIRSCREDEIDQAHFDTRQYNHIVWNTLGELRERLVARMNATAPLKIFKSHDRS